jgi:G3E family GTPase
MILIQPGQAQLRSKKWDKNMDLLIITGFLGSGKTTLLLEVAKKISGDGKKVAIIENEVGELGIDDCIIKQNGYDVREIYSGCICCSLRMDLITTLLSIEREYEPEIVILEPSGVAGPRQVLSALNGYGGEIESKTVINIVDASRFLKFEHLDLPLIKDGIETADIIVLNKKDLVSDDELCELRNKIQIPDKEIDMVPVSMLTPSGSDKLIPMIISKSTEKNNDKKPPERISQNPNMPEPAVFSYEKKISFKSGLIAKFKNLLIEAGKVLDRDDAVIGHLKIMLNGGKNGYVMLSLTSSDHSPAIKGKMREDADEVALRINAIAYDVSKDKLQSVFQELLKKIKDK